MITDALLWSTRADLAYERLGGLTILERQLHTAKRAGLRRVWLGLRQPDAKVLAGLRIPEGLELLWSRSGGSAPRECQPPYLTLSGDHLVRVETLSAVAAGTYPMPVELEDAGGAAVIQVMPKRLEKTIAPERQRLPDGSCLFLEKPLAQGPGLRWLLSTAARAGDGFMARNFDRRISLSVSRLLLDTPVSPNLMTVASTVIGVVGGACFAVPSDAWRLAGAFLVWLHSVVDGCDGELSRLRFQESAFGADLDFWGDNLVHLALFLGLGWGYSRQQAGDAMPLVLGCAAAAGSLGSAAVAYRQRLARRRGPALEAAPAAPGLLGSLTRLEDALAQRDFIYLLLVLAYFHLAYAFLWAAGIGSIAFFLMTLYLGRTKQ